MTETTKPTRDSVLPAAVLALFPSPKAQANVRSIDAALASAPGRASGIAEPHRLVHFLAQLAHESAGFTYDREIWGPTPAQKRYDTRTDLGNTPEIDGDGKLYAGRTAIQLTGKANVTEFRNWARAVGMAPPDFVEDPDLLNTDPWEGLAPVWYWMVGNPTGRSLNALADKNDIEQITKAVNGGLNGYADRLAWYGRIALAMAHYDDVREFQKDAKSLGMYASDIDGDMGPQTRAALHMWLAAQGGAVATKGPVVEKVGVETPAVEGEVKKKFNFFGWVTGLVSGGGLSLAGLAGMDWKAILAAGGVLIAVSVVAVLLRHQLVGAIRDMNEAGDA